MQEVVVEDFFGEQLTGFAPRSRLHPISYAFRPAKSTRPPKERRGHVM